jgi:hypothetical protein
LTVARDPQSIVPMLENASHEAGRVAMTLTRREPLSSRARVGGLVRARTTLMGVLSELRLTAYRSGS